MSPLYPHLRLSLASENPLAWVSAVRQALRRSGAGRPEIDRFSAEAFAESEPEAVRRVCAAWTVIEHAGTEPGPEEPR